MPAAQALLKRLKEIGESLKESGRALALIGLGSVGVEQERLDEWSDLDFFAVVQPGTKRAYIEDLGWLSRIRPIAYRFANTADGYKLLFDDGIFCEFAVFEPDELKKAVFSTGRIVWKQPYVSDEIRIPEVKNPHEIKRSQEWIIGEALTNLYVGLGRDRRGEHLSAFRFIQHYAVDRLIELSADIEKAQKVLQDEFSPERRYEQRSPMTEKLLPGWMQGYEHNPESALSILAFLEQNCEVNPAIAAEIKKLCAG